MKRARSTRRTHGFTLIEVIVVVAIIAIIAAIIVPRLMGQSARKFDHAAEQVRDMLTIFAQRTGIGTKPSLIAYDDETHALKLFLFNASEDSPLQGVWEPDPAILEPVQLREPDSSEIVYCFASIDDESLGDESWHIATNPNELRPYITITLINETLDMQRVLELAPHAIAPRRLDRERYYANVRDRIYLDEEGRGQEDW